MNDWIDNEEGPDCECGGPTVVKRAGGKWILLCFFHDGSEGVYKLLPDRRPDDWYDRVAQNKDDEDDE